MVIKILSSAFNDGESIPLRYSCEGSDISPPIDWDISESQIPDNGSITLICDDPDAPGSTWIHWLIFNLPPETRSLPEMVMPREELENGAMQGSNSWGNIGYGGPCPPSGTHRYYFKVYALDTKLDLIPGATKEELLKAMKGHVIDEGQLMGTYTRR